MCHVGPALLRTVVQVAALIVLLAVARSILVKNSCECGVFALEKIPCGCMLIVCEEAGIDPALLLEARDTAKFWKELYEDLPEIVVGL